MHDIVREAELAVMDGYLMEGIKTPHSETEKEFLSDIKKLPKSKPRRSRLFSTQANTSDQFQKTLKSVFFVM